MQAAGRPPVVPMRTLVFPASFEQLDPIREFVGQAARDADMSETEICAVQMAVDEACSNIIEHAYHGREGEIEVTSDFRGDTLTIILRDYGDPFDPAGIPEPNLSCDLEDRRVGGLGVYLMRQLMDEVKYEQQPGAGNLLFLVKRRRGTE